MVEARTDRIVLSLINEALTFIAFISAILFKKIRNTDSESHYSIIRAGTNYKRFIN